MARRKLENNINLIRLHANGCKHKGKAGTSKARNCQCMIYYTGRLNGKTLKRTSTGLTDWNKAEAYADELLGRTAAGEVIEAVTQTIRQTSEQWLEMKAAKRTNARKTKEAEIGTEMVPTVSEAIYSYRRTFTLFLEYCDGNGITHFRSLTAFHLSRLWATIQTRYGARTLYQHYICLRAFFEHAQKLGFLDRDIDLLTGIEQPTFTNVAKPLTETEISALYAGIENHRFLQGQKGRDKMRTLVDVLYHTGLRIGDAMHLHESEVDFKNCIVRVNTRKKKIKVALTVPRSLCSALKKLDRREGYFFADPTLKYARNVHNFTRTLTRVCKAAGLEGVTAHRFRHTLAKRLLDNGANLTQVQKALGHARYATTEEYYASFERSYEEQMLRVTGALADAHDRGTKVESIDRKRVA